MSDETRTLESWIVEIRQRLEEPPPRVVVSAADGDGNGGGGDGDERRRASALVPLWVDAGELWTLVTERAQRLAGHRSPPAFPGALVVGGEEAWEAALRGGEEEAGLEPKAALELGRLDQVVTPAGVVIVPCVAALPKAIVEQRGEPSPDAAVTEVVPLPLSALADPRMVERRAVEVQGQPQEIVILHVGKRRIWGVTAAVIANLLVRLGLVAEPQPGA